MIATASDMVCVFGVMTAIRRPSRWMWMRSATSNTCGMLWLIRTIGRPRVAHVEDQLEHLARIP